MRAEVITRSDKHADLLDDVRRRYGPDGAYAPEVVASSSGRSARPRPSAGYFNLAVPESMGGGGMGHLAYYAAWEHIYHAVRRRQLAGAVRHQPLGVRARAPSWSG